MRDAFVLLGLILSNELQRNKMGLNPSLHLLMLRNMFAVGFQYSEAAAYNDDLLNSL